MGKNKLDATADRTPNGACSPRQRSTHSPSERRSAVTDADRLAWAALSRRRRFSGGVSGRTSSRTSEGSGVERLLLYLNRDTWIGQDGDTLAEVVRDARYAAGHTSWHGSSDRAQLRH